MTPTVENPLQDAISQLRSISEDRDLLQSTMDAGSLQRIALHITNIHSSVMASTRDHANASKRLNDFAATLVRMAWKTTIPNDALTNRMSLIAANLRGVSDQLAGSPVPAGTSPAPGS